MFSEGLQWSGGSFFHNTTTHNHLQIIIEQIHCLMICRALVANNLCKDTVSHPDPKAVWYKETVPPTSMPPLPPHTYTKSYPVPLAGWWGLWMSGAHQTLECCSAVVGRTGEARSAGRCHSSPPLLSHSPEHEPAHCPPPQELHPSVCVVGGRIICIHTPHCCKMYSMYSS